MIDGKLTSHVVEAIAAEPANTLEAEVSPVAIAQFRELNARRVQCFTSKEAYDAGWPGLQSKLNEFRTNLEATDVFRFLKEKLPVYTSGDELRETHAQRILLMGTTALNETLTNAILYGQMARVRMAISKRGIAFDVNHGNVPFPQGLFQYISDKVIAVRKAIEDGMPLSTLLNKGRESLRTKIGYVPAGMHQGSTLPFRFNGLSTMLTNDFYRHGFSRHEDGFRVGTMHTPEQLKLAHEFRNGNKYAGRLAYGDSITSGDVQDTDRLFSSEKDRKTIYPEQNIDLSMFK